MVLNYLKFILNVNGEAFSTAEFRAVCPMWKRGMEENMYFGSVRFFRHLIVGFVVITMTVTTILSIVFGIQSSRYKKLYDESRATVEDLEVGVSKALQDPVTDGEGEVSIPFGDSNDEEPEETVALSESELAYQSMYPDMICDPQEPFVMPEEGTVYLTFDDGPSDVTESILDTLKKHDVKATFFVIGKQLSSDNSYEMLDRILAEGHELAIHGYSHDYNKIYESVEAFLDDFYEVYSMIVEHTGHKPTIYRFPGGSINGHNQTIYKEIIAEMSRRGFVYYDWNGSAEDAVGKPTAASVRENVLKGVEGKTYSIILMHDTVEATGQALDGIITTLKQDGYEFDKLSRSVKPIMFSYTY